MQPNKHVKLAGGDRFNGSGVLCPWRGHGLRPTPLRRRARRPQLTRDPLGRYPSTGGDLMRSLEIAGLEGPRQGLIRACDAELHAMGILI